MQITRRTLGLAVVCSLVLNPARPALALPIVIPVEDLARFEAMRLMLVNVATITQQVGNVLAHVQNAAASLGGGNLVDDILLGHRRLTADLAAISYSTDTVTQQFRSVFPDQEAAKQISPSDAAELRTVWDRELHQSALAASRAQSALSTVERNTKSAQTILERSMATTGGAGDEGSRLAKLQALVQMLGVINSDLTTLATTIATTERVNASVAAAGASDEELEAAKAERMLRDYAKDDPIPEIDPRVLSW